MPGKIFLSVLQRKRISASCLPVCGGVIDFGNYDRLHESPYDYGGKYKKNIKSINTIYKCKNILYTKGAIGNNTERRKRIQYSIIGILILAVLFDLYSYKIPNALIVTGIGMGILYAGWNAGWKGLLDSIAGIGLPVAFLFILFQLRMLGAGDIKLFAVIGGIIGHHVLVVMLYSFLAGGVLSAVQMFVHHNLVHRMKWFWNYIRTCFRARQVIPYESGFYQGNKENTIHFSIAVGIGYSVWLLERWLVN